jgi:hypothetical protein
MQQQQRRQVAAAAAALTLPPAVLHPPGCPGIITMETAAMIEHCMAGLKKEDVSTCFWLRCIGGHGAAELMAICGAALYAAIVGEVLISENTGTDIVEALAFYRDQPTVARIADVLGVAAELGYRMVYRKPSEAELATAMHAIVAAAAANVNMDAVRALVRVMMPLAKRTVVEISPMKRYVELCQRFVNTVPPIKFETVEIPMQNPKFIAYLQYQNGARAFVTDAYPNKNMAKCECARSAVAHLEKRPSDRERSAIIENLATS